MTTAAIDAELVSLNAECDRVQVCGVARDGQRAGADDAGAQVQVDEIAADPLRKAREAAAFAGASRA